VATEFANPCALVVPMLAPGAGGRLSGGRVNVEEEERFACERLNPGGRLNPDGEDALRCGRLALPVKALGAHGGREGSGDWTHPCCTTNPYVSALRLHRSGFVKSVYTYWLHRSEYLTD